MLFGLAPALQATKVDFTPALKENRAARNRAPGRRFRPRLTHSLIVLQIAVSLLLVIGAGLFVRTLSNLHSIDVGFNRENLLLVTLNGRQGGYREAALARFYQGLLDRFREIPGVRAASASNFPLVAQYVNNSSVKVPGRTAQPGDPFADLAEVDPAFLDTMQIPILLGRNLEQGDLAQPNVAVVDQKFASAYFGTENPIGRQFQLGGASDPLIQIVGVAKAAHYNSLQEEAPEVVYRPYTQNLTQLGQLVFELRTAGPPLSVDTAVRRIVHDASASVSISNVVTQAQSIDQTISQQHTFAELGSCFAALALLIASWDSTAPWRTRWRGGQGRSASAWRWARRRRGIIWMVLREVLAISAAGLLLGYGAARFTTHFVESFLYGLKPNDPLAIAAAVAHSAGRGAGRRISAGVACVADRSGGGTAERVTATSIFRRTRLTCRLFLQPAP